MSTVVSRVKSIWLDSDSSCPGYHLRGYSYDRYTLVIDILNGKTFESLTKSKKRRKTKPGSSFRGMNQ